MCTEPKLASMKKISFQQLTAAESEYFNEAIHLSQRFGQFLMNKFWPNNSCPQLFHERKHCAAYMFVSNNLVEWESSY